VKRAVIAIVAVALFCLTATPAAAGKGATAGARATNFTLRDLKGKYVRLSDFKDKVVLMSFWAVWCKPCLVELKHLQKIYKKYKDRGFVVLAVSIDGPETQAQVKSIVRRYKLTFPVAIDKAKRAVKLYNPKLAAPFSVLIDRGKVVKKRQGFQVSDAKIMEKEVRDLLDGKK